MQSQDQSSHEQPCLPQTKASKTGFKAFVAVNHEPQSIKLDRRANRQQLVTMARQLQLWKEQSWRL